MMNCCKNIIKSGIMLGLVLKKTWWWSSIQSKISKNLSKILWKSSQYTYL